jgi:hypothetical protein
VVAWQVGFREGPVDTNTPPEPLSRRERRDLLVVAGVLGFVFTFLFVILVFSGAISEDYHKYPDNPDRWVVRSRSHPEQPFTERPATRFDMLQARYKVVAAADLYGVWLIGLGLLINQAIRSRRTRLTQFVLNAMKRSASISSEPLPPQQHFRARPQPD